MEEDIRRLFEQEVREKRVSARGAQKKKGRRGLVGKMLTPADFSGREYRKPGDMNSFNITDLLTKLSQAPTLKEVLLSKMDEEYKTYRLATERTIDAVAEVVKMALEPMAQQLWMALDRVDHIEATLAGAGLCEVKERRARNGSARRAAPARETAAAPAQTSARIRWGSTPAEIRTIVAQQLQRLHAEGKNIDTKTIRAEVPSMLKWLYGKRAVFDGLEDAKRSSGVMPPAVSAPVCPDAAPAGSQVAAGPSGS